MNQNTVKINKKNVKMIAHRGLSGIERENTASAFIAAANRSYFGIETDVHVTADGEFVIIHDESTYRVSGGRYNVNVEESMLSDLEDITLPDLDGSTHRRDIRIPTLTDYISICKKYGKKCVLELKNPFNIDHIQKMVDLIEKLDYLSDMIFISFSFENCLALRELLPHAEIQWLTDRKITDDLIRALAQYGFDLDVYYKNVTAEAVERLHREGVLVNCWTCDDKVSAETLVDAGVDFITTNILE